jgi:hypothetical protein
MSESPQPLGPLILLIVGVLLALAIFWVGFMLAPAAVLLISYLALSAGERARRQRAPEPEPLELPTSSQGASGGHMGTTPGGQLGARRRMTGVRREEQAGPSESDLVEAGATSQPRGAQAL